MLALTRPLHEPPARGQALLDRWARETQPACLAAIERSGSGPGDGGGGGGGGGDGGGDGGGGVAVSLRYRPSAERGVALQGFAAELAIKSDEYKTIDDRRAPAAAEDEDADDEGADEEAETAADSPSWMLSRYGGEEPLGPDALPAERLAQIGTKAAVSVLRSKRPLAGGAARRVRATHAQALTAAAARARDVLAAAPRRSIRTCTPWARPPLST